MALIPPQHQTYFAHIRKQHPDPQQFSNFLEACYQPLRKSIRVNTLKISVVDFQQRIQNRNWMLTPIPWCAEGFWISHEDEATDLQLGNTIEHFLGLFYIQEASSMLPPEALFLNKPSNEYSSEQSIVLDMAAAPGSKTTQLAALMNNSGTLIANELSASRLKVLHANLQRLGANNYCLTHLDGTLLDQQLSNTFDAILLDAPCGGEGTLRKDDKALDNWSVEALESLSKLQIALLRSAWNLLKPGGRLVYSTCTLSSEENHQVIQAVSDEVGNELKVINLQNLFDNASAAITEEGYLRVWPEIFDCEGFFVACLEKSADAVCSNNQSQLTGKSPFLTLKSALNSKTQQLIIDYYQQHFGFDLKAYQSNLMVRQSHHEQQVWLFPAEASQLRNKLRLQRSGIRVCDLIESRKGLLIRTQNEFATSFGEKQSEQITNQKTALFEKQTIELNTEQAKDCCRGNNIKLDGTSLDKGEVLMRYQGFPLGLAKLINNNSNYKLKNNLPRDILRDNIIFFD